MSQASHYRTGSNFDESCHFCGEQIAPGSIVAEAMVHGEPEYAHEDCLESAIENSYDAALEGFVEARGQ